MNRRAALLALSLILSAVVGWGFAPASYDDGYITYRYADNLLQGQGFVFNPGEPVLGTSAPGYALFLAGLASLFRPAGLGIDTVGAALFLSGLAVLPLLLSGIFRRLGANRPELVAGIFALLAISARWTVELMGCEQIPILVLVSAALLLALKERDLAAGTCAGLAAAMRFDAGLAVASLALALWIDRRRLPWRFAAAAGLPVVACWIWLYVTFGTILPVTLAGKTSEMEFVTSAYAATELRWLIRSLGAPGTLAVVALALLGLVAALRLRGRARLFAGATAAWLAAHELFYHLAGVPFAPWYHFAAFLFLLALGAQGAAGLLPPRNAGMRLSRSPLRQVGRATLATLLVGTALFSAGRFFIETWGRPPDPRIRLYRDIATKLRERARPEARVASVEIGALAYFADRRIVDLAGLLDPGLRTARRENRLPAALGEKAPDYLVDNPAFHGTFLKPLVETGELDRSYLPIATFSRPEYPHPVRLLARHPRDTMKGHNDGTP
jgi:hypothetical protein